LQVLGLPMILEDGSFDMAVTWYYISFILIVNWILLQARLLPNPAGQLFILSTGYSLNSLISPCILTFK
jgi:hypothetical protein